MKTDATVKNYHMKMIASDGGEMEGQWTGGVTTTVKQSLLTIPVLAIYKVSKRWELELGPWFSYLTSGEFFGTAYDGYIRDVDPTGVTWGMMSIFKKDFDTITLDMYPIYANLGFAYVF